jgi:hypothetical protein
LAAGNQLLFTRRIADPDFGARLTGKAARFSVGALFASDRAPGERATFSALRVSRDLPRQSNIGAMYSERRLGSAYNGVADVDGTVRIGRTWRATLLAANSWTRDDAGHLTSRSDVEARINREGRGFNYDLQYVAMAPDFTAASGFIFRTDNRYLTQDASYTFWPKSDAITKMTARLDGEKGWFFRGGDSYTTAAPSLSVELNHQTTIELYSVQWQDVLRPIDYAALPSAASFREASYGATGSSTHLRWLRFTFRFEGGKRLHYVSPAGQPPLLAAFDRVQVGTSVRPSMGLTIQNTYLFDRNETLSDRRRMFSSHIVRTNWNWQFTREFSARFIAQYNALVADPMLTSTTTERGFNADFLVTYLVHPGTAIYVGYNHNLVRPGPAIGRETLTDFVNDGRKVFVKASYLLRF